jgi:hypothetical protein
MPVVSLYYKPHCVPEEILRRLAKALPEIIAGELDVPENKDARLTAGDIEIHVTKSGPFDTNIKNLEIMIWAHEFPERLQNIEERKNRIVLRVRLFFTEYDLNIVGWVWILLQPTAFGRI